MDIGHERVQQNHEQNETHIRFNGFYALHCDQNDVNRTGSGGPAHLIIIRSLSCFLRLHNDVYSTMGHSVLFVIQYSCHIDIC